MNWYYYLHVKELLERFNNILLMYSVAFIEAYIICFALFFSDKQSWDSYCCKTQQQAYQIPHK